MTKTQVKTEMNSYNFEFKGTDGIKYYYNVNNGPEQNHLIIYDEVKNVITHKITNENGNCYIDNDYHSIDELVDNLNIMSGGLSF
jgi:hypothetical protein